MEGVATHITMPNLNNRDSEGYTFLSKDYDWPHFYLEKGCFKPFSVILRQELDNAGIEINLEYDYVSPQSTGSQFSTYSSKEFPAALLKLINISLKKDIKIVNHRKTPTFIVANSHFALTSNDDFKFYVPELKQGFKEIGDALTALDNVVKGDLSHVKIIHTEHVDLENLPKTITCKGKVWTPYKDKALDMNSEQNRTRFADLIQAHKEQRGVYIQNILKSLAKADQNKMVVCCDVHGSYHLIRVGEITTISVKNADSLVATAEIILSNRAIIKVDLEKFAKLVVNYEPEQILTPVDTLENEHEVLITISQPVNEDVYRAIFDKAEKRYKMDCDYEAENASERISQSSDNNDDNIEFDPDFDLGENND